MSVEKQLASQLRVAKEDLDGALQLAKVKNRNAVYLLEQAAEKVLLAVLTSEGKHGGIRHQLASMAALLPDENPLKPALGELAPLAAFATTYRYATESGRVPSAPPDEFFTEFANKTQQLLTEIARRFGVDLAARDTPARTPQPIR